MTKIKTETKTQTKIKTNQKDYSHIFDLFHSSTCFCGEKEYNGQPLFKKPTKEVCSICLALWNYYD